MTTKDRQDPADRTVSRPQTTTDPASFVDLARSTAREACLVIAHSPDARHQARQVPLGQDLVLLGREIDAGGVSVDDRLMSRVHARFAYDTRAGMYRVGDARSRNGTFVNGERIETRLLSEGDVIRAGDTLLVYSEGSAWSRAQARARALARTDLCLLVLGETGTGKEVLARLIHKESGRRGELVAINCASVPSDLVGAEFFGHTKSAFSGAIAARKGLFAAADGGTLLLDEVGDCPLEVQAALLRAIQEKAVRPIGSEREVPVDVRIIAATHQNLGDAVTRGSFRADLLARLSQASIELPALRARKGELLPLAETIARQASQSLELSADAAEALLLWDWPLNVRELQSLVNGFLALHAGQPLDLPALVSCAPAIAAPLIARMRGSDGSPSLPASLAPEATVDGRARLRVLLDEHAGNVSAVADALGKPRAQVYRWMKAMGLSAQKFRR